MQVSWRKHVLGCDIGEIDHPIRPRDREPDNFSDQLAQDGGGHLLKSIYPFNKCRRATDNVAFEIEIQCRPPHDYQAVDRNAVGDGAIARRPG